MFRVVSIVPALLCAAASVAVRQFAGVGIQFARWRGAQRRADQSLNLSGTLALPPNSSGTQITVPVAGRNEPGKLILKLNNPQTGEAETITYVRGKSEDGAYAIWQADDAPDAINELRAPINASSEPASSILEGWSGDINAVVPVEVFSSIVKTQNIAMREAVAAKREESDVAVVTDRKSFADWDGAASRIGATHVSSDIPQRL